MTRETELFVGVVLQAFGNRLYSAASNYFPKGYLNPTENFLKVVGGAIEETGCDIVTYSKREELDRG